MTPHPSYTARFAQDLKTPGVRVPLTAVPELWAEAVAIGREVIWLHTYGREFTDPAREGPPERPDSLTACGRETPSRFPIVRTRCRKRLPTTPEPGLCT